MESEGFTAPAKDPAIYVKSTCKEEVKRTRYPAYVTSAGLLRYDDDKVRRLRLEALHQGFNHFKMKVGSNIESDLHH